ncbi:MAG: NAD-dependent deacetylase [Syntrophobacteraceae bacterium]
MDGELRRAAEVLGDADALLITAGAGIGVDSGLPDFRGDRGFWKAYPLIAQKGLSFVEMANPEWFQRDPSLAWAFYGHRLNLYRGTSPHDGFHILLELARKKPYGYFVFTSNVDGQFQKAGFDENRIVECHGSIHRLQCVQECSDLIWDAEEIELTVEEESFKALESLPKCPKCGCLARPNILMFGDWQWISRRTDGQSAGLRQWLTRVSENRASLAIVEAGAGRAVSTVRSTSESIAARYGATLVRVNPRDFEVPGKRHISIPLGALEGISRIDRIVEE